MSMPTLEFVMLCTAIREETMELAMRGQYTTSGLVNIVARRVRQYDVNRAHGGQIRLRPDMTYR